MAMKHIKGLRIDEDGGAGSVRLPASFLAESAIFRADVLQDWIGELTVLYDAARLQVFDEWAEARAKEAYGNDP
jgi:hypothetical protein